jgi:uncharacterized membrane protein YccC
MKINKEQFDALVAKLDALQSRVGTMDKQLESSFSDLWKNLDKLLQSHAALEKQAVNHHEFVVGVMAAFERRLMEMQSNQTRWIELYEKKLNAIGRGDGLAHFTVMARRERQAKKPAKRAKQ